MSRIRVASLSTSDGPGGAGRAAYRLHCALRAAGVESTLHVSQRTRQDPTVLGPEGAMGKAAALVRPRVGRVPLLTEKSAAATKRSVAILPSIRVRRLNRSDVDLCHLHWVADEMLSVADIGRIRKPVVWTLHDMWPFCGAEHLAWDERFKDGYHRNNRPPRRAGLDLDRWTWKRKRRAWRRPLQIVTPSRWLAECVRSSALMAGWPVAVIPNPIDPTTWRPIEKPLARGILGIRAGARLVAFGSMGENRAHHKGGDLLAAAIGRLRAGMPNLEVLVFGEPPSSDRERWGVPTHSPGILHDELSMRLVYSAADALVVPSRIDNLPYTGLEAHACGTPVVAFDTCGLPDIVIHEKTGYLARPFDAEELAHGIEWVAGDADRSAWLGRNARATALDRFDATSVGHRYRDLYGEVLERQVGMEVREPGEPPRPQLEGAR